MIFGRADACARIDSLLLALREGTGNALALSGPAGIGKSTLLDFAADHALHTTVIRAIGSPAETGVSYAGLSQVLTPLLDLLPSVPSTQAAAIESALAIGPSNGNDAFPVYAGTLSLLAAAAARGPIVVLVDDGHWLDSASIRALLFAQRRLSRDRVLFIFAARPDGATLQDWADVPTIELAGLDLPSASALVADRGVRVNHEVLAWLVESTGGNPLALLDLPTYVSAEELALLALRSGPAPAGPVLTAAYGNAVSDLPPDARMALLITAMLDDTSVALIDRALGFAGLSIASLEPAEDVRLLSLENGIARIRHPLARSAVIQLAPTSARRAAHLACAEALRGSHRPADVQARVWHLADASAGVDESLADLLEEQARSAMARTGYAAACLINKRAADLSPIGPDRTRRLLAAAEAGLAAGLPGQTQQILNVLDGEEVRSPDQAAAIAHLGGRLRSASGDPPGAAVELLREAVRIRHLNPAMATQIALDAAFAAVLAGRMDSAAEAAHLVSNIGPELGPLVVALGDLLVGTVQAMSGEGENARARLDSCRLAVDVPDPPVELLQQLVYLPTAYLLINAFDEALPLLERAIGVARLHGAMGILPFALAMSATVRYRIGDWETGYAHAVEAVAIAEDIGQSEISPNARVMIAQIDAARGRDQARADAMTVIREASGMGATFIQAQGLSMLGLLELSIGHPAAAIAPLEECGRFSQQFGGFELGHLQWAAELIEAKVRSGQRATTAPTLLIMREAAHPGATTLNRAVLARCEGILATDSSWDEHFRRALYLHAGANLRPFELARTELCYGERLRRHRRRKDAREHLTRAWETFDELGAQTWAQRAAQEIAVLGGAVAGPVAHLPELLTPQEFQVAMAVANGATNREVANSLFLSQKTVEFHLSAVYRRLGLRSRGELADALRERTHQRLD